MGLDKFRKRLGRTVNSDVRICVECGSERVIVIGLKKMHCQDCGSTKHFFDDPYGSTFKKGDKVRIIDQESSLLVYTIEKVSRTFDGKTQYLLKSDRAIKLLYHETNESHLEKV